MTLVIDLPPEKEAALKAHAQAAGVSAEEFARRTLSQALRSAPPVSAGENEVDDRPIWEVIVDNMKDVPAEELAKLPKDGASQIDHYLYGAPKR